jgi:tetratricopeptide (TPR) repeat protein
VRVQNEKIKAAAVNSAFIISTSASVIKMAGQTAISRTTAARFALASLLLTLASCAMFPTTPPPKSVPVPEPTIPPRTERALANLSEGLKRYDAGNFEEAKTSFLLAADSGVLSTAQQLDARKHMAFIYALQNRESSAREEFEKAFALDAKFELTPAEAGHPKWGPVYRQVKADVASRRTGWFAPKPPTQSERMFNEAMVVYDTGDYAKAVQLFADIQKEPITVPERVKVHKQTAFAYCLLKKNTLCSGEFTKILKLQSNFELSAAEAGHPSWGTTFRKAQVTFNSTAKDLVKDGSKTNGSALKK